jgi:hypothetical protein
MFHPFRTVVRLITTVLVVLLLLYTHNEAFKAGMSVRDNPVSSTLAHLLGFGTTSSCPPSQEKPFYSF